ncbi:MAG: cell division protein SepF [Candidatus Gastranaerophilaceae bacterium]
MKVQDTLKSIVDQLTKGFSEGEEIYTEAPAEEVTSFETDRNLALAPEVKQSNLKAIGTKVVTHTAFNKNNTEVIICEPRSYSESVEFVKYLRDKKSIIVNLNFLDAANACRLVDFLCGATHALNGNQHKISENVFIFTPVEVSLSAEPQNNKTVKDAIWN